MKGSDRERQLQKKIDQLRAALEMVELIDVDEHTRYCPWCDVEQDYYYHPKEGLEFFHNDDCPRQEALKP